MTKFQPTRRLVVFGLPLMAMGCGPAEPVWAPDELVLPQIYRHPGQPMLTLFTMKSRGSGSGAHTGLMVSASQRVIFDPAGTFGGTNVAERNDVIFGITPRVEQYYMSYHARETYYVTRIDLPVPASVAEQALQLVQANGAVPKAYCARSTSEILSQLPGLQSIRPTMFPNNLERQFERLPGVTKREYYEDDADDKNIARAAYDAEVRAGQ